MHFLPGALGFINEMQTELRQWFIGSVMPGPKQLSILCFLIPRRI